MPLRPIDAIFIHLERRLYVIYYRGALWQLPRMKIDEMSWKRRQPYQGSTEALYLSRHQSIHDPVLAQKLRTLDLPIAVRGITLPRFEAWWETHGFDWLREKLAVGQSPLAAHTETNTSTNGEARSTAPKANEPKKSNKQNDGIQATDKTDVFADMLADLIEEVLYK